MTFELIYSCWRGEILLLECSWNLEQLWKKLGFYSTFFTHNFLIIYTKHSFLFLPTSCFQPHLPTTKSHLLLRKFKVYHGVSTRPGTFCWGRTKYLTPHQDWARHRTIWQLGGGLKHHEGQHFNLILRGVLLFWNNTSVVLTISHKPANTQISLIIFILVKSSRTIYIIQLL